MGSTSEKRQRIAIDFDGVLHSYCSGYNGVLPTDPPTPGAVEFCEYLLSSGYEVVVHTARMSEEYHVKDEAEAGIREWFRKHGFPAEVAEGVVTNEKPAACLYLDDRGLRFNGDFGEVRNALECWHHVPPTWANRERWSLLGPRPQDHVEEA